jgi:hypothetical protein
MPGALLGSHRRTIPRLTDYFRRSDRRFSICTRKPTRFGAEKVGSKISPSPARFDGCLNCCHADTKRDRNNVSFRAVISRHDPVKDGRYWQVIEDIRCGPRFPGAGRQQEKQNR